MRITKKMYDTSVEQRIRAAEAMATAQNEVIELKRALKFAAKRLGVYERYSSVRGQYDGLNYCEEEVFDHDLFARDLWGTAGYDESTKRLKAKAES